MNEIMASHTGRNVDQLARDMKGIIYDRPRRARLRHDRQNSGAAGGLKIVVK